MTSSVITTTIIRVATTSREGSVYGMGHVSPQKSSISCVSRMPPIRLPPTHPGHHMYKDLINEA